MSFGGLGGVATVKRPEVMRASRDVPGDSVIGRVPEVVFVKFPEGKCQNPTKIATPRL